MHIDFEGTLEEFQALFLATLDSPFRQAALDILTANNAALQAEAQKVAAATASIPPPQL